MIYYFHLYQTNKKEIQNEQKDLGDWNEEIEL